MITALYASVLAMLMIWLSIEVIKQRRSAKVAYADGGVNALQVARSAQGNAMDYIPITLFLMAMFEYNGASPWMIHIAGAVFVIGRLLHAKAVLAEKLKGRITGMKLTFLTMVALIVLNLVYLPFGKLW
ncbi:MAPEG family protein [Vibrio sp. T11.5]|uniref:MAPEG family protein n=1 Tax=Vibrio sp. T11.5 TaxID=2998836 RepID=UPI0022CD78A1|nr:MAPEG family protein [Vibrio sp. T11.5]MDA0117559.1 MAPEG family protein [Vibrio sp. T11.5]